MFRERSVDHLPKEKRDEMLRRAYSGDRIVARGALVDLQAANISSELAVCVIDREGVRNLSPPWEGYYI